MNSLQLTETDLRLLRVLDVLLDTGEVVAASHVLGVTASAVSHSLRLLRQRFNDPLLVRVGGRLRPTPLAIALRPSLRAGLSQLAGVLTQELGFDLGTSTRIFSLATTDYPLFMMLPTVIGDLRKTASGIDIRIRSIGQDVSAKLGSGDLDLVLANAEVEASLALDREVMRSRIIAEPFRCVMRREHPAAQGEMLKLEDYVSSPHVLVSTVGSDRDIVDDILAGQGMRRRVAVTVPSFMTAAWFAAASDMIATLPAAIAQRAIERTAVVSRDPPFEMPSSVAYLWWHPRLQNDPGHTWWRQRLLEAFAPYRS